MKVAIDARALTTQPTGVGHYLLATVNVWSALVPETTFVLLAHKPLHPAVQPLLTTGSNVRFACCPAPRLAGNGLWWLIAQFGPAGRALGADVLWGASGLLPPRLGAPTRRPVQSLLTVHDLAYRTLPWTLSYRNRVAYGSLAGRSIRHADCIWAVSGHTASEIRRHYPRRRSEQIVVGSGTNPLRTGHAQADDALHGVRQRYGVTDQTLLFVGTLEPRKNLRFLLTLMPRLAAMGYRLLVVGCAGWGDSGVAEIVKAEQFPASAVRFCSYVPDDDLQALYRSVSAFVSTSLLEGFGLPLLEAMEAGCPTVAAANSAMVEVVGTGGIVVTGWEAADWTAAIDCVTGDADAWQARASAWAAAVRSRLPDACRAVQRLLTQGAPAATTA